MLAPPATKRPLLSLEFSPSFQVLLLCSVANKKLASFDFHYKTNNNAECFGSSKLGEMLTVLGPNPKVQTTLLHTLSGKHHALAELASGEFTANETEELFQVMRHGFVVSKPQHMKTSTVEEELQFVFDLRFPNEQSADTRKSLVYDLLVSVNLLSKAKKQVGTLARWELKRLALAVELISLPNILFVDQPLADNRKADWEMIQILQALQRLQICQVVVSLHDPGSEIFQAVSNHLLMLNALGSSLFVGNANEALPHFAALGYPLLDTHTSTGDHLLLCAEFAELDTLPPKATNNPTGPYPAEKYPVKILPQRNQFGQFLLLLKREAYFCLRDKRVVYVRLFMAMFTMAVCAVVFLHVGNQTPGYFVGSHFGSFVFPFFVNCFGVMVPTTLMLSEVKALLIRERSMRTYRLLPLLFAKLLPELVINFAVACIAIVIMYFSAGWTGNFMLLTCALFLLLESCISYCYFFVFFFDSIVAALVMVVVTLVPQLLFMGTFVRQNQLQNWLEWISYVCTVTYSLRIVSAVEFDPAKCTSDLVCSQWSGLLAANSTSKDSIWWYCMVLGFFFLIYRVLGFLAIQWAIKKQR
ncbi:hypothetical protein BASA81_001967 [Batrachochytrium salamandrivorans]|nr:hypothetical protein BASA81_001967 [Batrachochytrium salamandrivorans]